MLLFPEHTTIVFELGLHSLLYIYLREKTCILSIRGTIDLPMRIPIALFFFVIVCNMFIFFGFITLVYVRRFTIENYHFATIYRRYLFRTNFASECDQSIICSFDLQVSMDLTLIYFPFGCQIKRIFIENAHCTVHFRIYFFARNECHFKTNMNRLIQCNSMLERKKLNKSEKITLKANQRNPLEFTL